MEELKPCPFCGQTDYLSQKETPQRTPVVWCSSCTMEWVATANWESAYCWKEIQRLREALEKIAKGVDHSYGHNQATRQFYDGVHWAMDISKEALEGRKG